jgi:hypothetical protein
MGINIGYSTGKKERTSNSSRGVKYDTGKNSSIAKGISSGRYGGAQIDVGYARGKENPGCNCSPDPKNRSKPFTGGSRA